MTLSRRIKLCFTLMTAGLSILVGALLWGLHTLHRNVAVAFDEYREAQLIERAMFRVAYAHIILRTDVSDLEEARAELAAATELLREFLGFQQDQQPVEEAHEAREESDARAAFNLIRAVSADLTSAAVVENGVFNRMRDAIQHLKSTTDTIDHSMVQMQLTASQTMTLTLAVAVVCCVAITLIAVVMNLWQYRCVIRPLHSLRDGARRFASGRLDVPIAVDGDEEFAEVEDEFNRMARELSALHHDLEEKVRVKSNELVRSERLASVGYLAAGVAHEINNPLNIISGFAELSLKELRNIEDSPPASEISNGLRIICEESFRCKEITDKLLSLSTRGDSPHRRVSLAGIAEDIATMLPSLKQYRGRNVAFHRNGDQRLDVVGNETELKQVILNLTINALDSVEPGDGEVVINGVNRNGCVEISVTDNGRGIAADVIDHVFEPFFTTQRRAQKSGTGLGLAITHAIVESHGGSITAASAGPDRGSEFTVRLPACPQ